MDTEHQIPYLGVIDGAISSYREQSVLESVNWVKEIERNHVARFLPFGTGPNLVVRYYFLLRGRRYYMWMWCEAGSYQWYSLTSPGSPIPPTYHYLLRIRQSQRRYYVAQTVVRIESN